MQSELRLKPQERLAPQKRADRTQAVLQMWKKATAGEAFRPADLECAMSGMTLSLAV